MDNKQNRKLYWEIKDFYFNKNDMEFKSPKKSSLVEDITNMLKSQTNLTENDFMIMKEQFSHSSSDLKKKTTDMLYSYQNVLNKQKSSNIKNSNTITANPFSLKEQLATSSMGPSTLNVSKRGISLKPDMRVSTNISPDGQPQESTSNNDFTFQPPDQITKINSSLNLSQIQNQQQTLPGVKPLANNNLGQNTTNQTTGPSMETGVEKKKIGFENIDQLKAAAIKQSTSSSPTRGEDTGLGINASDNAILFGKSVRAYK